MNYYEQLLLRLASDDAGAAFGLTAEETAAHRQAFMDAAMIGGDAFLAAVEREKSVLASETLSVADRRRLEARRNVATVIEDYFMREALADYDGTAH